MELPEFWAALAKTWPHTQIHEPSVRVLGHVEVSPYRRVFLFWSAHNRAYTLLTQTSKTDYDVTHYEADRMETAYHEFMAQAAFELEVQLNG